MALTPAAAPPEGDDALFSIADVEREAGLPRATIRIWERRYGFPAPLRDERGERCYTPAQVEQLRLMSRLVTQGHRPGKLLADGARGLREAQAAGAEPPQRRSRTANALIPLLRRYDTVAVLDWLAARLEAVGLVEFAVAEVPQMNAAVGQAWVEGELQPFEEHLFSDCLAQVMRPAIAHVARNPRPEAPTVLLTTLPQESHGIGLLMAQAIFASEGCPTIYLGVQLPPTQIVAAARAYGADLVGLSCSPAMNPGHLLRGLEELRGAMPLKVRIWAGGSAPVLSRRPVAGVRAVPDLRAVPAYLAEDFALPPRAAR